MLLFNYQHRCCSPIIKHTASDLEQIEGRHLRQHIGKGKNGVCPGVATQNLPPQYRFGPLHFIASIFLFMKMPCISQSEWHVAPPPQPLPNSHLHINLLHSTEPDI